MKRMAREQLNFRTNDDDDITVVSHPSCCVVTVDQGNGLPIMFELTDDEASTLAAALLRGRMHRG